MTRRRASSLHGIYAIVNESPRATAIVDAALSAGVRLFQYRAKRGIDRERLRVLVERVHDARGLLLLDDDWLAAREFGCDGVHLGPDDDGFDELHPIRAAFPSGIVGLSCGTQEEMRHAQRAGADYAGIGPVYATTSKDDAGVPIGIDGLRRIAAAADMPVAAIGGIAAERIGAIKATGVAMASVIGVLENAADCAAAARALVSAWEA